MPTISYKHNINRGIVLIQTGQQVEHLQSCIIMTRGSQHLSPNTEEPESRKLRRGRGPSTTYRYTSLNSYKPKGKPRWKINMIRASACSVCGIHRPFPLSSHNTKRPTLMIAVIIDQLRYEACTVWFETCSFCSQKGMDLILNLPNRTTKANDFRADRWSKLHEIKNTSNARYCFSTRVSKLSHGYCTSSSKQTMDVESK